MTGTNTNSNIISDNLTLEILISDDSSTELMIRNDEMYNWMPKDSTVEGMHMSSSCEQFSTTPLLL